MIGVIADDLTGAAEIAAMGWHHGLRAEIVLKGEPGEDADLVCIDTDSRSCVPAEAAQRVTDAAAMLQDLGASWIYKKTDSVLRGNVTPEIEAVISELGLSGALIVTANPSRGRTIVDGHYLIDGKPIHRTGFANDPEHPRLSSDVTDLLSHSRQFPVLVVKPSEPLHSTGIFVAEVASSEDVEQWAANRKSSLLMAGGVDFFEKLLDASSGAPLSKPSHEELEPAAGELFICGSTSEAALGFLNEQFHRGVPLFRLPERLATEVSFDEDDLASLANEAIAALQSSERIILHIGLPRITDPKLAKALPHHLAELARRILQSSQLGRVFAEGGATSFALAERMGWNRLTVARETAPGVVTLATTDDTPLLLTIKPGSYAWPEAVATRPDSTP